MSLLDEAREAATDSARKSIGKLTADEQEEVIIAVVAIVEAAIRPLAEAIVTLTNAMCVKQPQEPDDASLEEDEKKLAARVRPLAAVLILSFGFLECQKFARNNGGADPGRYLPHPIAFEDAAMMIASDLLQRANHAKLLRALIDERPRCEKELRNAMAWVTDAELAAFPALRRW